MDYMRFFCSGLIWDESHKRCFTYPVLMPGVCRDPAKARNRVH
jgi:hypothetical protein